MRVKTLSKKECRLAVLVGHEVCLSGARGFRAGFESKRRDGALGALAAVESYALE